MSFSKYLDSKRGEIKQLVAELKKSFLYVSVLGVDIKATSFRVDKNTSNIDPGNDVECGFVIKMSNGHEFYEYSLDDISGDMRTLAQEIVSSLTLSDSLKGNTIEGGILAGYPMIDVKVELYDGSYHEVDSSEMAFKIAGSMAIKEGCRKARPCILEPMMKVEIEIPEEFTGTIIGDISRRRGRVEGQEPLGNTGNVIVRSTVPLANMFGYATDLRSNTQGRGTFSMEFKCYEQVPANVEKEIIEKAGASKA